MRGGHGGAYCPVFSICFGHTIHIPVTLTQPSSPETRSVASLHWPLLLPAPAQNPSAAPHCLKHHMLGPVPGGPEPPTPTQLPPRLLSWDSPWTPRAPKIQPDSPAPILLLLTFALQLLHLEHPLLHLHILQYRRPLGPMADSTPQRKPPDPLRSGQWVPRLRSRPLAHLHPPPHSTLPVVGSPFTLPDCVPQEIGGGLGTATQGLWSLYI